MVHPSSHNVAQPFSSHLDWMSLERVARHMLTRAAAASLPQQVRELLQVSGFCSSCQALQWSLRTPPRAVQQKAALFISYLHPQTGFLSEHLSMSQRFPCTSPPSAMATSARAGKFVWANSERLSQPHVSSAARTANLHHCPRALILSDYLQDSAMSSSYTERGKLVHIESFQGTERIDIAGDSYTYMYLTFLYICLCICWASERLYFINKTLLSHLLFKGL